MGCVTLFRNAPQCTVRHTPGRATAGQHNLGAVRGSARLLDLIAAVIALSYSTALPCLRDTKPNTRLRRDVSRATTGFPQFVGYQNCPHQEQYLQNRNDIDRAIGRSLNQASQDGCHGAQARQEAGARHARLAREGRANLRVAALPPRKKVRGALDPPCAPRPTGCAGARGAQTHRRTLAARRQTRGMDWIFRFWRVRLGNPGEAAQIPPLTNPIQDSGRSTRTQRSISRWYYTYYTGAFTRPSAASCRMKPSSGSASSIHGARARTSCVFL